LSDDPQPQAFQLQKYLRRSRPLVASFAVKPLPLRREIEIHWIPGKLNEDASASTLAALTSAAVSRRFAFDALFCPC
jgi:hypothetical protein